MEITLRAPGSPIDALTLGEGLHAFGRAPGGGVCRVEDPGEARAWIRVDRCGTWLSVVEGVRGVHLNGRPVCRCALLRAGDSVHLDGNEMVLTAPVATADDAAPDRAARTPATDPAGDPADPRMVLRGIGGRHHGRSFTLDHAPHLDGAHVAWEGGRVVLRVAGHAPAVAVNGVPTRGAILRPGDQLAFAGGQRYVVEAPLPAPAAEAADAPMPGSNAATAPDASRPTARRLPLLLVAALLLAVALGALLLL